LHLLGNTGPCFRLEVLVVGSLSGRYLIDDEGEECSFLIVCPSVFWFFVFFVFDFFL
jgi:hypothetical protein